MAGRCSAPPWRSLPLGHCWACSTTSSRRRCRPFKPAGDVARWFDLVISLALAVPGPIGGDPLPRTPQNPLGMVSAGQAPDLAKGVGFLVTPTVALVALVALALRFRRARGAERQQHKWFAYGTLLLLAGLAALFLPLSEGVSKVIVAAGLAASPPRWPWPCCAMACTRLTSSSTARGVTAVRQASWSS